MSVLDSQWVSIPLGQIVEVLDFKRVPVSAKERARRNGDVPYYGAAGRVGSIDAALFDEPLLLLGEDGVQFFDPNKQKSYLIDGPAWVNNHAHVLRVGDRLDRKFLNFYLNIADYEGFANGTTRLKLTQAAMRRIPVPVPPLEEQRLIVAILEDHLSCLDAADASARRAIRLAQTLTASSLATVVRTATAEARTERVGDHAEVVEYGTSAKCHETADPGDVPVLRMGNVQDGRIVWSGLKYLRGDHPDIERLMLHPGDLVFNRTNSAELVGKTAVVDLDRPASFASYLIRIRLAPSVDPKWVSMVINSPQGRSYISTCVTQQVGQANVNGTKLKAFPLPVPSLVRQEELAAQHESLTEGARHMVLEAEKVMSRSAVLRRSLLASAFSGRLTGSGPHV